MPTHFLSEGNPVFPMLRHYLPSLLRRELFGDREKYGKRAWEGDPDWETWQREYLSINKLVQHSHGYQHRINDSGYKVLSSFNFDDKRLLEIGAGSGYHIERLRGTPKHFTCIDVCKEFFPVMERVCQKSKIPFSSHTVGAYKPEIPLDSASCDFVLSFYSMEHLHPIDEWLGELFRVLKPGGYLIGAIPAEGGLAWGMGRWLTSKRIIKRKFNLDMRKIICWEHPNSCDEITQALAKMGRLKEKRWPFPLLPYDVNLVVKIIVKKVYNG